MTPTRGQAKTQLCRDCGRPRAADATRCSYCGKAPAVDAASVAAARAHEARLQRMSRPLRATRLPVLADRIHQAFQNGEFEGRVPLTELGVWVWRRHPALPEAAPFLVAPVVWIVSMVGAVLLLFTGYAPFFMLALMFAFLGGFAIPASSLTWKALGISDLHNTITDAAGDLVDDMEERVPVHCPQCGGHAAVVLVGGRDAAPCPWCEAPLELPQEQHDWIHEAGRVLEKRHGGAFDRMAAGVWKWTGPAALSEKFQVPEGYECEGFVLSGTARGFPVREFAETSSFPMYRVDHIELMAATGLAGEALWTPPRLEKKVRHLARVFRIRLPQSGNGHVNSRGWFHETAPRLRVPPLPELNRVLDRLGRYRALLIDPGGVTVWRFMGGVEFPGDKKLAEFHDELAALALALRAWASRRRSPEPGEQGQGREP